MALTDPNTDAGTGRLYKIKLVSGRVLGPIGLDRVKRLILKNRIIGKEVARTYPDGEWVDINQISEIAELLVAHVSGQLTIPSADSNQNEYKPILGDPGGYATPGATQVLGFEPEDASKVGSENAPHEDVPQSALEDRFVKPEALGTPGLAEASESPVLTALVEDPAKALEASGSDDVERTEIGQLDGSSDKTTVDEQDIVFELDHQNSAPVDEEGLVELMYDSNNSTSRGERNVSQDRTVVFERSSSKELLSKLQKKKIRNLVSASLLSVVLIVLAVQLDEEKPTKKPGPVKLFETVRPLLPAASASKPDPDKSNKLYAVAMGSYILDTAIGYRTAADKLRESISYDVSNVKALAMLASSYINLIDSSNKDENYFSVLTTLIDMSRAKSVDLAETVIADVEFFSTVNKAEAAQNRVVEYTKSHPSFGPEMFYYLGLAFNGRGDNLSAAKYLGLIPDKKIFSAKIYYLRGQVAEALNDLDSANQQYSKAIVFNPGHAKSHLRISQLLYKKGSLRDAQSHIDYLMAHTNALSPKDLGAAFYLHALLSELNEKWKIGLTDMENAVTLDPENHDYILELYTLRSKSINDKEDVKKIAKMYYFLGEGEKLIQIGKYQEALLPFLQAREVNDDSPLPLLKMGDMFNNLHNVEDAKANYKMAADRAPDDIQVWSKYIDSLIQSFEWAEASKAMDRFRKLPVSQSSIDKAAADMSQKQGRPLDAQLFYKKAMARDRIDSAVYAAYARSLMSVKNFKDAPFFFSLALRFDPLNVSIKIDIAKCVAETESIDRAINMLQDEINRSKDSRADYLAAIADLEIQKGSWEDAKYNVQRAIDSNPDYAYSWKILAQIYMNQEGVDKTALENALAAYKSFSERNPSDPSGYLERYKIFAKKAQFAKAKEELDRIYSVYPKYPNLHYFQGALYAIQGRHDYAASEFKKELQNNPNNVACSLAYGRELMDLGHPEEALVQYNKAMELSPKYAEAKQEAGWANLSLKNYPAAINLMRSAIELDKANPLLYKRLGLIHRSMNDPNAACAAFRKYLEMEPDATDKADFTSCL